MIDQAIEFKDRVQKKHFKGIPDDWHETIRVPNYHSNRVKLEFKCVYNNCNRVFTKSCNLKAQFSVHSRKKTYECHLCHMKYT